MCFSATASFVAGVALATVGIATLRLTSRPSEIPLAAIPLLFGIQQIIEGLIWLSFRQASPLPNLPFTFVYSLFSNVLWPIYVPFAIRLLETVLWRRKALLVLQIAGIAVGLYLFCFLVRFSVTSRVLGQHIVYGESLPFVGVVMTFYLSATCVSSMLASHWMIRMFGVVSLATFIAAYAINVTTLASVWCFFAAVLSFFVYAYLLGGNRANGMRQSSTNTSLS